MEEEEQKAFALRKAIEEGVECGVVEKFEPEKYLKAIKSKRNTNPL